MVDSAKNTFPSISFFQLALPSRRFSIWILQFAHIELDHTPRYVSKYIEIKIAESYTKDVKFCDILAAVPNFVSDGK
jgi:hypothetical protein